MYRCKFCGKTYSRESFYLRHELQCDMKQIVNGCKRAFDGLGSEKIVRIESQDRVDSFRRSVVTKQKISKGTIIQRSMLDVKRPGTGLPPEKIKDILGKKALRDISEDEILKDEDF